METVRTFSASSASLLGPDLGSRLLNGQRVDAVCRVLRDRLAVPDPDDARVESGQAPHRRSMLPPVQIEGRPACAERWPRRDRIPGDQEAALGPVEGEVTRRMAGRMENPKRA